MNNVNKTRNVPRNSYKVHNTLVLLVYQDILEVLVVRFCQFHLVDLEVLVVQMVLIILWVRLALVNPENQLDLFDLDNLKCGIKFDQVTYLQLPLALP